MNFVLISGITIAAAMGIFLFLETAWALSPIGEYPEAMGERVTAAGEHPAVRRMPSQNLFRVERNGARMAERFHGRDMVKKMNEKMTFIRDTQNLTAPDAFRSVKQVVPESPDPSPNRLPDPNRRMP